MKHILLWTLPFFLVACSADEQVLPTGSDAPITFVSSIGNEELLTRAIDQNWAANDAVGVFMTNNDYTTTHDANKQYKAKTAGTSVELAAVSGNEIYYPAGGSDVRFIAYSPYSATIGSLGTPYPITLGNQAATPAFDLLWHKDTTTGGKFNKKSSSSPELAFTHQLSKVVVNIKLSTGMTGADLTGMVATLKDVPTTASFNLSTGAITGQAGKGNVVMASTTTTATYDKTFQAIIVPHAAGTTFTGRTMTFKFVDPTDAEVTLTWDGLTDTRTFASNTLYTYNLNLTRTAVKLTGSTIKPWSTTTPVDDTLSEFPEGWDDDIDWTKPIVFDGESNCYIVPPGGQLLIPISRAKAFADSDAGQDIDGKGTKFPVIEKGEEFYTKVYWTDNTSAIAAKTETETSTQITTVGTGPKGYILVKPGSQAGNAVVALQKKTGNTGVAANDYTTLWSWHIWVVSGIELHAGNGYMWMDRNLGATTTTPATITTLGLFYQWGRKDPFPGSASISASIEPAYYTLTTAASSSVTASIQQPTTYFTSDWLGSTGDTSWDNSGKTIFDPCPVGYRVPLNGSWGSTNNDGSWASFTSYGRIWNTTTSYYPAAGFRDTSSVLSQVGTHGYYWSNANATSTTAYYLNFNNSNLYPGSNHNRKRGYPVRCIQE